jgi:uncharacterized membrane protein
MSVAPKPLRLTSVDALRGLVIVVMALDHVRDFFHFPLPDPTDIPKTTVVLFFTRWITHFCAPAFMLTAGIGAGLSLSRGRSKRGLSWFLLTRGLWLVVLELTWVRSIGWMFNFDYTVVFFLVIWTLGWSMVLLAGLIWLPRRLLIVLCLTAIVGHNALDHVEVTGGFHWLWTIVHAPGNLVPAPGYKIAVPYVLLPWVFVMALGYCCAPIFTWEARRRQRALVWTGTLAIAAFVVIRAINGYGDTAPWTSQRSPVFTLLSFLNTQKYPPSLDFLLMTLGPACLALALFERWRGRLSEVLLVYGRTPMFFYLLHIPLIHLTAVIFALARYGAAGFLFRNSGPDAPLPWPMPPGYGYSLWVVYGVWLGIVAALYPLCKRFGEYKRTHRSTWLSYF